MTFTGPHTAEARQQIASGLRRAHAEGRRSSAGIGEGLRKAYAAGTRATTAGSFLPAEDHRGWKGDRIGYRTAHRRVERAKGKPDRCESCSAEGDRRFEWALRHEATVIEDDLGRRFSIDPEDYVRLCCSCHYAYDREVDSQ